MIENQSDNIDIKENDVSNQDNALRILHLLKRKLSKMMNYLQKKKKN